MSSQYQINNSLSKKYKSWKKKRLDSNKKLIERNFSKFQDKT